MVPPRLGTSSGVLIDVWLRSARQTAQNSAGRILRTQRAILEHANLHPLQQSATAAAAPLREHAASFLRSIAGGVFKSVRTASQTPYGSSFIKPRTVSPNQAFRAVRGSARARPGFGGPTPRPTAFPSNVSHVGLGPARNFSSSRPIFENVINNVPLGLRALVDSDGIDQRKWRKTAHTIRKAERTAVKGQGRPLPRAQEMRMAEFASFFGSTTAEASAVAVIEQADVVATTDADQVVLVIPLEPSLSLPLSSTTNTLSDSSSYRLLNPAVLTSLHAIQLAYESHAHRVRGLSNRLTCAGVFDDSNVDVEMIFIGSEKFVEVRFPTSWTRRDVEQACGEWRGAERWYDIHGGEPPTPPALDEGQTDDLGSWRGTLTDESLSTLDEDEHDHIASTFILPTIDHVAGSLVSPEISPEASHWSESEGWDAPADQATWGESDGESRVWGSDSTSETDNEDQREVRSFLEDLETLEREREFRPAMVGGLMG
ncbi:hypothetical protein RQP46_005412 [Phenoliferia psychrophenolica]